MLWFYDTTNFLAKCARIRRLPRCVGSCAGLVIVVRQPGLQVGLLKASFSPGDFSKTCQRGSVQHAGMTSAL